MFSSITQDLFGVTWQHSTWILNPDGFQTLLLFCKVELITELWRENFFRQQQRMQILIHTGIPLRYQINNLLLLPWIEIVVLRRQAPVNIAGGFLRIPHLCQKIIFIFRFDIPSETQSNYMRGFSLRRLVIQFNSNLRCVTQHQFDKFNVRDKINFRCKKRHRSSVKKVSFEQRWWCVTHHRGEMFSTKNFSLLHCIRSSCKHSSGIIRHAEWNMRHVKLPFQIPADEKEYQLHR